MPSAPVRLSSYSAVRRDLRRLAPLGGALAGLAATLVLQALTPAGAFAALAMLALVLVLAVVWPLF